MNWTGPPCILSKITLQNSPHPGNPDFDSGGYRPPRRRRSGPNGTSFRNSALVRSWSRSAEAIMQAHVFTSAMLDALVRGGLRRCQSPLDLSQPSRPCAAGRGKGPVGNYSAKPAAPSTLGCLLSSGADMGRSTPCRAPHGGQSSAMKTRHGPPNGQGGGADWSEPMSEKASPMTVYDGGR